MSSFRELRAWQLAHKLAIECSNAARSFPRYELFTEAAQLRRSAYSVPLNIAEGSSRLGPRDCRRILDIALASFRETEAALLLARDQDYINPQDYARLETLCTETGKTLSGLLRAVSSAANNT